MVQSFFYWRRAGKKALRRDCMYNIENADLKIGFSGVDLNLLIYFDTQYALRINSLK